MSSEGSISTEVIGKVFLIGLNRPEKYNAYTPTMAKQLVEAFTRLDEDDSLWVGLIHAHGDHFTSLVVSICQSGLQRSEKRVV